MTAWSLSGGSRADPSTTLQMGPVTFRARSWLDDSPDLQHPQVGGMGPGRRLALRCMCVAWMECRLRRRACQTALLHLPPPAPQFDNSTTPVVLHPVWQFNYGHTATASIA